MRFPHKNGPTASRNSTDRCRWLGIGTLGMGSLGLGLAVFLSVKSSPSLSAVHWLPHFITHWADRHGRLCNFPAYAVIALPFLLCVRRTGHRAWVVAGLAILITGLEVVQLWIPARVADKWDVFWGCSGVLTCWVVIELIQFVWARTMASQPRPSQPGAELPP